MDLLLGSLLLKPNNHNYKTVLFQIIMRMELLSQLC